jgi:hypothetical protein
MDRSEIEDALFLVMRQTISEINDLTMDAEDDDDIAFIFNSAKRIFLEELELEE